MSGSVNGVWSLFARGYFSCRLASMCVQLAHIQRRGDAGFPLLESIMVKTTQTAHRFYVKEREFGLLWLIAEPFGEVELPAPQDGFMGFSLAPGTTMRQAHDLANLINQFIVGTSITQFQG
jgi:hypothetical protein